MILSKIKQHIAAYQKWLGGLHVHPRAHLWESQLIFQEHWKPEAADLAAMFDQSLQNSETRRLWQTENWRPKQLMLQFWKFDQRAVGEMFDDLFNETRPVEARIGRFLFGCDLLLSDFKRANLGSIENNHYHADYQMIALYLAFRYPDTYGLYELPIFRKTMTELGSRDIPAENDLPRYFKVQRTLFTFLEKDPALIGHWQRLLNPRRHFTGKSLLWASDFCRFVAGEK